MASAQERVKLGASFLDQYRPGWAKQINLQTFDIGRAEHCILGQLDGEYVVGLDKLIKAVPDSAQFAGSQMGFDARPHTSFERWIKYDDRQALQKTWVREVKRRQGQAIAA